MPPEKRTLVLTHFPRFLSDLEEEIYSAGHRKNTLMQLGFRIRIRIGSVFTEKLDTDLDFEYGSGS